MDTESPCGAVLDASPSDLAKIGGGPSESHQRQQPCKPQPQQKKQLRRRHSTSRPYQERLLNMAEARREIVAALKFHRATMKRAGDQQQQRQEQQEERFQRETPPPLDAQQKKMRTRKNPRTLYPFNTTTNSFSYSFRSSLSSLSYPRFSWDDNPVSPLPCPENLDFILPNKPLGLNLNFDYFANMHTTVNTDGGNPPSHHPSSSCSHSNASPVSTTTSASLEVRPDRPSPSSELTAETASTAVYAATISEEHTMEWKAELNSAISAWWCKFVETKELSPDQVPLEAANGGGGMEGDDLHSFDGVLDIPAWLGDQEHLNEYYSEDYLQDIALPCLDIGEIEGVDCEWLS